MYLEVSPYKDILAGVESALALNQCIIQLTGTAGTGKTALGYQLSERLQRQGRQVVFFLHAPRNAEDLQNGILRQLHLREKGNFTPRLTDYLISLASENRALHVLIDNAQRMDALTFDAVRQLCTIQDDSRALVRVVLLGSPELEGVMDQAGLHSSAPPAGHSFQLQPLQHEQTKNFCCAYWRNKQLDRSPPDDKWVEELQKISGGLPGAVLAELGDEEHRNEINISARIAQVVAEERQQLQPAAADGARSAIPARAAMVIGLLAIAAFGGYRLLQLTDVPVAAEAAIAPSAAAAPVLPTVNPTPARPSPSPPSPPVATNTATVTSPADSEPALAPAVEAGIIAEAEVVRLLNGWVQHWQAQDLPGYFASYGLGFVPETYASRAAWEAERRRIISTASNVNVGWRELQIRSRDSKSMVVELWLDYASSTYADRTLKELTLGFENGRAVINRERNLTVQP